MKCSIKNHHQHQSHIEIKKISWKLNNKTPWLCVEKHRIKEINKIKQEYN